MPNAASYTDLGNGAVLDNVTCLTWQKTESTTAGTMTENLAACAKLASDGFAGFSDWRLPTRVEMASIADYSKTGSALDPIFTKEVSGYDRTFSLWYETIAGIKGSTFGWVYNMSSGLTSNAYAQTSTAKARCVRGNGTGEELMQQAVEPPNHYAIGNGEVTDAFTGLVWQQAYSSATMAWSAAAAHCSSVGLNGHAWRVPSLNELATLVDEARVAPAINRTAFPNTVYCGTQTWFWASEAYAGNASYAWGINFCDGYTGYNSGASGAWNEFAVGYVRCVR
jgi:hypothetical protein